MSEKSKNIIFHMRTLAEQRESDMEVAGLLSEAADRMEDLETEISDAWVWLESFEHAGDQETLAATIEIIRDARERDLVALRTQTEGWFELLAQREAEADLARSMVLRLRRMLERWQTSGISASEVAKILEETKDTGFRLARSRLGAENASLKSQLEESILELAAEHGEAEGGLPGWRFSGDGWVRDFPFCGLACKTGDGAWSWSVGDFHEGRERTARAAMRAADVKARELGFLKEDP